jgi:hypothetical protein
VLHRCTEKAAYLPGHCCADPHMLQIMCTVAAVQDSDASEFMRASLLLCIRIIFKKFENKVVCLNVCPCKHECEQATILRTLKRTCLHAVELAYLCESVIVYICAHVISSVRFGVVHASGVKNFYAKPHGRV